MRIFNLNPDGECDVEIFELDNCDSPGIDVSVFIPGPPGPQGPVGPPGPSGGSITDVGTRSLPVLITSAIASPVNQRQRSFISGNAGPVLNPTLGTGSGTQEWWLFTTNDTNTVSLNNASNLLLSGEWIGRNGSMLLLIWDNNSMWVEAARNEI